MTRYHWARRGDVNAFFGLMLDNVAVMVILVSSVTPRPGAGNGGQGPTLFTPEFVLTRMIPGTAFGVLLGDLVYTAMAFRLARRTGRHDVTAMPLGLDTPSTFGVAFLVLRPALTEGAARFPGDHTQAMEFAWRVGLVVLVLIGVFKVLLSPLGNAVRRLVPRAGLLGSLAAIALALIAFLPLLMDIATIPLVGLVALAIILLTLVAHRELPGKFPGALAAVLVGVLLYQLGALFGTEQFPLVPEPPKAPSSSWHPLKMFAFYSGGVGWLSDVLPYALGKLPVMLPFALATIVGGIDCTESAAAAGDDYDTRAILLTEGVASLVAGLFGGVIQTTPYIGHPAYKKMGGRSAYTLATALFVGTAGYFGWFTLLFQYLPQAAMFPILVFVGLEITAQSFQATPPRHYPALALAMLPALAYLIVIVLKNTLGFNVPGSEEGRLQVQTLRCLANGFIVTSMLWAAALAMLLDGRLVHAAAYFTVAGVFALFGLIHSPLIDEQVELPNRVLALFADTTNAHHAYQEAVRYQTPYHWAGAYGLVVVMLLGLSLFRPKEDLKESGVA
jgi:AGZA family xanthine/uracil permease-like MFS transporter